MANFYPRYNQPQFVYGYNNVMNQNSMYNNNDYSNRNFFNVDNRFTQNSINNSNSFYPYPLSQSKPVVISDYKKQQQMEYKAYLDMQVANHRNSKINQSTPIVGNSNNNMSEMDREMIRKLNEKKRKEEYNRILQQQIEEKKKRKELERQKQIEYDMKFEEQLKRYEQEMNEKKKNQMNNNNNSMINKPIRPYSNNIVSKINLNLNNEPNPPQINNLKVLNRTKTQYDNCSDNMKFSFGAKYANMQTAIENNTPRINNNRVSNTKYNFFSNNEFDPNTIECNTVYNRTKSNFSDTNDMLNKLIEANFDRIKYDNEHNVKFEAKESMKRMTFGDNNKNNVNNSKAKESTIQRIVNDIDFNALEYRSKYENLEGTLKNDDDKMMQSMKSSSKLITPNNIDTPSNTAYKNNDIKKSSIASTAENIMRSSRSSFNNIKPIRSDIENKNTNVTKDFYKMKTSFSDYDKLRENRAKELGKNGDKIYDEIKDILSSKEKDIDIENKTKSILNNVRDEDSEDEVDKIVKKYANTKTSEIVSETLRSKKKEDDNSIYKLIQKHHIEDRSAFKDQTPIADNKSSGIFKLTSNNEAMKDNLEFKESKEQNFNIIQRKMIKEKVDNFQLESQRKEPEKKEELPSLLDSFSDILLDNDKEELKESFKLNKKEENIDEDNLCNIRYKDETEEEAQSNKEPSNKEEDDEEALITISNSSEEKKTNNNNTTDDFEDKMNFFGDSKYSNFNIAKSKKEKVISSKDKNRHMNLFNSIKESSPSEMMEDSYCDKIIENIDKYRQMAHTDNDAKQI